MKSNGPFFSTFVKVSNKRPIRVLRLMAHLAHGYIDVLTLFLALTVIMSFAQSGAGAVTEAWVQRYNKVVSNSFDRTMEVVVDNAGDIIVGGGTGGSGVDMLIIKYSAMDGSMIWQRQHEGPGRFFDVVALAVTTNGDVVATGYALDAGRREQYVAKYAGLDGALLWDRRHVAWTNTANALTTDVVVDKAGNVIAAGGYYIPSGADDSHITKYANDGSVLWQRQGITNRILAVEVDNNDNVVITGVRNGKYYTAKYGVLDGALVWENLQEGGAHIAVDQHGDVIVAGTHATRNDGISHDYYTAKLSGDDGDLIWQKSYNGPGNHNDMLAAAALDSTGNLVVTGISYESTGLRSSYTAKYAATDGALLWDQRHESLGTSVAISGTNVIVLGSSTMINYASDNGAVIWEATTFGGLALAMDVRGDAVAITGTAGGQGYERMNAYTARFAVADGARVWEQSYNGTANGTDSARAVALDPLGNVIVTGGSARTDGGSDYYTAKYAKSNGALLWDNRGVRGVACCLAVDRGGNAVVFGFDGTVKHAAADGRILWYIPRPSGDNFVPVAIAVDSSNNVLVTGWTIKDTEQGSDADFYTAKYAAAAGVLLWERRHGRPDGLPDHPAALAIDSSDNVIITGASGGCYTVKYRAADGAVLWDKRNSGVAGIAIAVDRAGNVAIAGAGGASVASDYYTAMLAAENGAVIWEQIYDIRGYSDDLARAITLDHDGNVIVTGVTLSSSGRHSYTIKYNGANGTRLWEKRYAEIAAASADAIGVDNSGNVVVSGTSWNGTNTDYYTVKYAAQDGTLLWEQRYNGPENGNDSIYGSRSLAVGSDGLIVVTGSSDAFSSRASGMEAPDYATVAYRDGLPPVSLEMVSSGVRLRLSGVPERAYEVQRALTVTGPWTTIATVTSVSDGTIDYTDAGRPAGSAFYRVLQR